MFETADAELDLESYPALAESRQFSAKVTSGVRAALAELSRPLDESILTVAVAGSLGRLESTPYSDVDCVVIIDNVSNIDPEQIGPSIEKIRSEFVGFGLRSPKADGIYFQPVDASALLDPASRGSLEETSAIFGTRMQILLDARPLYRTDEFISLRLRLLNWYGWPKEHRGNWTHLLNDLSRYIHSYAVWQQFKFSRSNDDGWYLRQAKMRSTRIATIAGLLFLLGETTVSGASQSILFPEKFHRTPLGRLQHVFDGYADANFAAIIEPYELLHQMLSDPLIRSELVRLSPERAGDLRPQHVGAYAQIHELSERLMNELTAFMLSRQRDWSPQIFRTWLL